MGYVVSTLRDNICTCFGRVEEPKDIETGLITPKTVQADIENDTDNLEHGTRIKYYVLNNGKLIHMV